MNPQVSVKLLLNAGMTQQEIADKSGVTQPTINRISKGKDCYLSIAKKVVAFQEAHFKAMYKNN